MIIIYDDNGIILQQMTAVSWIKPSGNYIIIDKSINISHFKVNVETKQLEELDIKPSVIISNNF